jgi:hypothetical protein
VVIATVGSDWAQVAVTALLGAVTAFLGLSLRQKRRQETAVSVAENRFDAYASLWSQIPYSPELLELVHAPALGAGELRAIFDRMTGWYYGKGGGLLLGSGTRSIYLTVKKNLICAPEEFVPRSLGGELARRPEGRSALVVRQLSLLRSAMRADLDVYGKPWGSPLEPADREFLYACNVPGWRVQRTAAERLHWLADRLAGRTDPSRYRAPQASAPDALPVAQ